MAEKQSLLEQPAKTGSDLAADANGSSTTPFDAAALFKAHSQSVVRISDKATLGPNILDRTLGSGFAIDQLDTANGSACRIATDNHVVAHPSGDAKVNLTNGKAYPFTVELRDEANDLAVLKIENIPAAECLPLNITDKEKPVGPGDPVLKMGARNGDPEFTAGVVETYFRREEARGLPLLPGEDKERSMLSVTTKVNYSQGGDSGGPMLDSKGDVIAVMDAEGPNVIAGTPGHLLLQNLQKLRSTDKP